MADRVDPKSYVDPGEIAIAGMRLAIGIGARLRDLRLERGLTQAEVARRIRTSRPNVGRTEAGAHVQRLETLLSYAATLGVPVSEIVRDGERIAIDRIVKPAQLARHLAETLPVSGAQEPVHAGYAVGGRGSVFHVADPYQTIAIGGVEYPIACCSIRIGLVSIVEIARTAPAHRCQRQGCAQLWPKEDRHE